MPRISIFLSSLSKAAAASSVFLRAGNLHMLRNASRIKRFPGSTFSKRSNSRNSSLQASPESCKAIKCHMRSSFIISEPNWSLHNIHKNAGSILRCYTVVYIALLSLNCTFSIQCLFINESGKCIVIRNELCFS